MGALNTIARGTIDNTFIDAYNKFDDHVHVVDDHDDNVDIYNYYYQDKKE